MQNGLYVAVSAQVALERRLETIADNIANMNTVGYRATACRSRRKWPGPATRPSTTCRPAPTICRAALGGLIKTDNPLDFAVQGDGWFGIQTPSGTAYTRDGRARIDESGTLRTLNGDPILDAGGAPILVDSAAGPLDRRRRRHDHPERPAGRRDRPLRHRSGRQPDASGEFGRRIPTSRPGRSSTSPATASSRARSRARTSIRCRR